MGARSVVAALWPVADLSTSVWMSEFYRQWLNGEVLTDAVSAAQAHTRERWPSPYHWAAFSLFGMEK
jgi:CHAT domain-containing protein